MLSLKEAVEEEWILHSIGKLGAFMIDVGCHLCVSD